MVRIKAHHGSVPHFKGFWTSSWAFLCSMSDVIVTLPHSSWVPDSQDNIFKCHAEHLSRDDSRGVIPSSPLAAEIWTFPRVPSYHWSLILHSTFYKPDMCVTFYTEHHCFKNSSDFEVVLHVIGKMEANSSALSSLSYSQAVKVL